MDTTPDAAAARTDPVTTEPFTADPFTIDAAPRDEPTQYVLPLVVRIERDAPPSRTDALETAARAVLTFLADARSVDDGEWAQRVRDWQDARIRKVVRRARGAEWRKAEALPGITVLGDQAQVRVYPPVPLDGWPPVLAKLQVSGTDLDDPADPVKPLPGLPMLWLNPGLPMTAGKAMAQVGHAAQLAWWDLSPAERDKWAEADFPLAVRAATPQHWKTLAEAGLPTVRDAGFTEVTPGSITAIAEL
jgi:peptidyl-tRNA hydrolase